MSDTPFDHFLAEAQRINRHRQGDRLFSRGDPVRSVYLLCEGRVDLHRAQADGSDFRLHRAEAGVILAEASLYSDHYHCDADCRTGVQVAVLAKRKVLALLADDPSLAADWAAMLAHGLQSARQQAEILRRNRVSDRLRGWLDGHGTLPPKGQRRALAAELGVSPEALYRAIRAMRLT